jgi:hypothetical protein
VPAAVVWSQASPTAGSTPAQAKLAETSSQSVKSSEGKAMSTPSQPIVCKLNPPEFQKRRTEVLHKLKAQVKEQKSLSNGYALRFEGTEKRLEDVMQLLRLERDCCSFLTIKLTAEPNEGPLWLEITGPAGAKAFIKDEMGLAS